MCGELKSVVVAVFTPSVAILSSLKTGWRLKDWQNKVLHNEEKSVKIQEHVVKEMIKMLKNKRVLWAVLYAEAHCKPGGLGFESVI